MDFEEELNKHGLKKTTNKKKNVQKTKEENIKKKNPEEMSAAERIALAYTSNNPVLAYIINTKLRDFIINNHLPCLILKKNSELRKIPILKDFIISNPKYTAKQLKENLEKKGFIVKDITPHYDRMKFSDVIKVTFSNKYAERFYEQNERQLDKWLHIKPSKSEKGFVIVIVRH